MKESNIKNCDIWNQHIFFCNLLYNRVCNHKTKYVFGYSVILKRKKNYVTSMRKMLLRVFSTLFNGMKNEVYYYHMLTFSHNKFFLASFNVALNSSRGKSWKTYACLANILTAATKTGNYSTYIIERLIFVI